jgi:hypothetical protein
MKTTKDKFLLALGAGLLVTATALTVNAATVQFDRTLILRQLVGHIVAGLVATLAALAIQLKYEGLYYRFAMDRVAIVAEVNHQVRNAVFPLCLALQRNGDADSNRMANNAVERINLALRDAMTDAFARNIDYSIPEKKPVRSAVAAAS